MAEVVDNANIPTLWYQLDEGDNDPATFVAYLIEGLRRVLPDIGYRLSNLLKIYLRICPRVDHPA